MTTASDARNADAAKALTILLQRLGDDKLRLEGEIAVDETSVAGLLRTTWAALERKGYVEDASVLGSERYNLTPPGWLVALDLSGVANDESFQQRVQQLLAALKATVKVRTEEGILDVRDLARDTGLPLGWLWNAVEAQLPAAMFPGRGYELRLDMPIIFVPPDFGHQPLEV